ncbi:MFS transporter [Arthrobacter gandavensis]|uniref:MFS transporter n=1 Tax=Arthrobacter gandavensis TaxID=169960 RepID=UPI00188FBC41|nr:MFS transporter [Arthrobacter gandavensis]MBF4995449.1 MFS transporter [Arthrobacter gandavensis]
MITHPAPGRHLVMRNANFRALWVSSTMGILGGSVTAVVLPIIAAVELGAGDFAVAALSGMVFLPWLLFGLPVGVVVDRRRRRPVILFSLVARIVLLSTLPIAYWLGVLTTAQLFIVSFLAGLAAVYFTLAEAALIPRAVTKDELVEGNGLMTGSGASADAVGRGLGGWMTQAVGASNSLLVQLAASVASFIAILGLKVEETVPSSPENRHIWREMGSGLRYSLSTTPLRVLLLVAALWNLGGNIVVSLIVLLVVRTLGESGTWLGFLMAATAVGGTLGGLSVKRLADRFGSGVVWRYSMFPAAAGYAALLLMTPGWGMLPGFFGMFLTGLAISMNIVVSTSFRQRVCPPDMMGRLGSATRMVSWGMLAVASLLAGVLAVTVGVRSGIVIGILIAVLAPFVASRGPLRGVRHLEDLEPAPADAAGGKPETAAREQSAL